MEREAALEQLGAESWHARLRAARALGSAAEVADLKLLQRAHASETVSFVQNALGSAIRRLQRDIEHARAETVEDVPQIIMRQLQSRAVEEVTRTILHEIESIAGSISLAAAREIPSYGASATKVQVDRLSRQLEAIGRLKAAAAPSKPSPLKLGNWIRELVDQENADTGIAVSLVGPDNLTVEADPALLSIALCNGLRNAIEAVQEVPPVDNVSPITVSWDATDIECWIAIRDDGPGLVGTGTDAIPMGRTTKAGHSGMGLMTAKQAMESLGGSMAISNGQQGGAMFELRWFGV